MPITSLVPDMESAAEPLIKLAPSQPVGALDGFVNALKSFAPVAAFESGAALTFSERFIPGLTGQDPSFAIEDEPLINAPDTEENRAMAQQIKQEQQKFDPEKAQQEYDALSKSLRVRAKELSPDPLTTGWASQLIFDFGRILTKAGTLGGVGGVPLMTVGTGALEGTLTKQKLSDEGIDEETAVKLGLVKGAFTAGTLALPVAGATKLATAGYVVAGGPAAFVTEQAISKKILLNEGLEDIAQRYDPLDLMGLALSIAVPATIGVAVHAARAAGAARAGKITKEAAKPAEAKPLAVTQEQADAARVSTLAGHIEETRLSKPFDADAASAHVEAYARVREQIDTGNSVDVAEVIRPEMIGEEGQKKLNEIAETITKESEKLRQEREKQIDFIREDVSRLAKEAGIAEGQARAYADIYASRYEARAERLGVEPVEAYRTSGLSIQKGGLSDVESRLANIESKVYTQDKLKETSNEQAQSVGAAIGRSVSGGGEKPPVEVLHTTVAGGRATQGWSRATRAVRASTGEPAVLYRGAAQPLESTSFDKTRLGGASGHPSSGLGVWFTTGKGEAARYGKVEEFHLDLRKVKLIKADELPGFNSVEEAYAFREALRKQGFDGIAITAKHLGKNEVHFVAFSPEQVVYPQKPKEFKQSQPFYSALERAIPDLIKIADKQGMVAPEQAKNWLEARQKEGKFKKEELEWVGIKDWLDLQKGKVSIEAIQEFIKQNGVKVEEVMLGGSQDAVRVAEQSVIEQAKHEFMTESASREYALEAARGELSDSQLSLMSDEMRPLVEALRDAYMKRDEEGVAVQTKFSKYQLPGGKSYRELLLTLPFEQAKENFTFKKTKYGWEVLGENGKIAINKTFLEKSEAEVAATELNKKGTAIFKGAHFDQPNILAHIRFNERMTGTASANEWNKLYEDRIAAKNAGDEQKVISISKRMEEIETGKNKPQKVLFIEEIQSDWAQAKRSGKDATTAPFIDDTKAWTALSLKRMIRYAAENGYERIAWTTGGQQSARYDLSKQIQSISHQQNADGTYHVVVKGKDGAVILDDNLTKSKLEDTVGKDVTNKIVNGEGSEQSGSGNAAPVAVISGDGLKIESQGMKAYYDKIVPQVANDVLKKLGGGKVDEISRLIPKPKIEEMAVLPKGNKWIVVDAKDDSVIVGEFANQHEAVKFMRENRDYQPDFETTLQPSFEITPKLRDKALEGMPLFQKAEGEAKGSIRFEDSRTIISLFKNADASTFLHETGHLWLEELMADAALEKAPLQIKQDFQIVKDWLGLKEGEDIQTPHHEQFARAAEAYFMEGRAPTARLAQVFNNFKEWLQKIYRSVLDLDTPINDEIRGVFDRMLATDKAIAEYKKAETDISDPDVTAARQVIETDPDLAVIDETTGMQTTASKLIEEAEAEYVAHTEEAKGYKAAIECFIGS